MRDFIEAFLLGSLFWGLLLAAVLLTGCTPREPALPSYMLDCKIGGRDWPCSTSNDFYPVTSFPRR